MWSQELWLVGQIVLLFLALSFLYWVVFKRIQWRSALARTLTERVRVWAYLLIPLVPVAWGLRQPAFAVQESARFAENLRWFAEFAFLVVLGIFLVEASSVLVFDYLFAVRRRIDVPQILRSLARSIVYVLLFFFFFPRIFGWQDIAGLLTSSAIVSIIIGLALQETLGNLFAGISMQMSRPYMAGHWVKIGAYEGIVERADWRSMTIRTLYGDRISFPHSLLAKMEIHNYSLPSPLHARTVQVGVHYRHPPSKVEEILLHCTRGTPGVCAQPVPEVWLSAYQDFAILYTVKFWIEDFARYPAIESEVMRRVWYHFGREKIQIPFPIREVYHHAGDAPPDTRSDDVPMLKDIEFLQVLTDEQLRALAERLGTQVFARGEIICRLGGAGRDVLHHQKRTDRSCRTRWTGRDDLQTDDRTGRLFRGNLPDDRRTPQRDGHSCRGNRGAHDREGRRAASSGRKQSVGRSHQPCARPPPAATRGAAVAARPIYIPERDDAGTPRRVAPARVPGTHAQFLFLLRGRGSEHCFAPSRVVDFPASPAPKAPEARAGREEQR